MAERSSARGQRVNTETHTAVLFLFLPHPHFGKEGSISLFLYILTLEACRKARHFSLQSGLGSGVRRKESTHSNAWKRNIINANQ